MANPTDPLVSYEGAGSGGGGGGGAVTIANGADVTEGATTDNAVLGDTAGTISAKLRGINKILDAVWNGTSALNVTDLSVGATGSTAPGYATEMGIIVGGNLVGISSSNPIPISGSITASNPSIGVNGTTAPTSSTEIGFISSGNLVGVSSASPLPITGTVTAPNASVSTTGATAPTSATEMGIIVGGNLVGVSSSNPIPISGSITASNASIGVTGAATPSEATFIGYSNGTDLIGVATSTPLPITGTVTANQGTANATPWNANISEVGGSSFALGQQLNTASLPVVLTAAQVTTLTPPTTVTVTQGTAANLNATVTGTITANAGTGNFAQNIAQVAGSTVAVAATGIQKVGLTDGTGTAITSTGAALDVNIKTDGVTDLAVNLNEVGGSSFALGQQSNAASLPVVLTAAQITTLTPLSSVAVTQATASNLNATVIGSGTAGTAATGVVTIQGISGGVAVPISGSITASNASVGATSVTAPTSATEIGIIVAGDLVGVSSSNPMPISGSITASNASVGLTGSTAPTSASEIGWVNGSGNLVAPTLTTPLPTSITDGTNMGNVAAANASPTLAQAAQVVALSPNNTGIPVNMVAIVQKTSAVGNGTVTNLAKAFTSNNTKGNSIIVVAAVGNTSGMSVFDSNGNTYSTATTRAGSAFGGAIFYSTGILGGANTVTVSNTGVSASMAFEIYEVSGLIEMSPAAFDQSGVNSGTGTVLSGAVFTPTATSTYAFAGFAVGTAAQTITVTAGSVGWVNDSGQINPTSPSGLFSFASASAFLPTPSAVVVGAGIGSSEPWAVVSANFKPIALNIGGVITGTVIIGGSGTINVQGLKTNNNAAPVGSNLGVLPAIAATAAPSWTVGNQVALSTFLNGAIMTDATSVNGTAVVTGGVAGSMSVGGPTASGSSLVANPLTIGGLAETALPTAVSAGQVVNSLMDKFGRNATMPFGPRGVIGNTSTTITSSTSSTSVIAAVASQFSDLTMIVFDNSSATATHVTLSDGTLSYGFDVPAGDVRGCGNGSAIIAAASNANTAWTVTCGTSIASLQVMLTYVKNQ